MTKLEVLSPSPSVYRIFISFLMLGLSSFGGPVAHIGYFRKAFVEQRGWLNDNQFAQLLSICQFLPGPASSQLGFAIGLTQAGWLGAIAAFIGFTLPSALLLLIFASSLAWLTGEFALAAIHGLKLVACAVVADAVWSMFHKLCIDWRRRFISALVFLVVISVTIAAEQLLGVLMGAVIGLFFCQESNKQADMALSATVNKWQGGMCLLLFGLLFVLSLLPSDNGLMAAMGLFYQAGALVFGGGHVVLPLLEQSIVTTGLIDQQQFLAGYGAAQAIPGPMFSFAAYLGALIETGYAGWFSAAMALLAIFLPGFLILVAILPFWQQAAKNPKALGLLAGANAAVVGILAAALYSPIATQAIGNMTDVVIVLAAILLLSGLKLSVIWVVIGCVVANGLLLFI